jgi:integrase/recombinase XerC
MRTSDTAGYCRVRRRVKSLGWRAIASGETYQILDANSQLLHAGPLAETEAFLAAQPRPQYRYQSKRRAPDAWAQPIEDYLLTLVAAGQPENTTVKLRRQLLVKMAHDLGENPAELTADRLIAWFGAQDWATETRRSYRATVRGFLRWAYKTKRIPDHLADELPKVRERRGAPRPTPDRVWREALMAANPRVALMLRLAAEAGLRRGEVSRVHTRDLLDGIGGAQLLVHGKGGKQRVVPVSDSLADAIRAEAPTGGWVFPSGRGEHVTAEWVGEVCAAALPDGWTMHNPAAPIRLPRLSRHPQPTRRASAARA